MYEASVHGRFQPFHNGHLEYVLAAKRNCDFLWIGITKFDTTPSGLNPLGRLRERPENNPLTFFERIAIISATLEEVGIERDTFGFIPFPIEEPQKLGIFLPKHIPIYTTICEDWNREKIDLLTSAGYDVRVLWERAKVTSGSKVREQLIAADPEWKKSVPAATARYIEALGLADRLRAIVQNEA
jgi:cytidyltransferase-like protein